MTIKEITDELESCSRVTAKPNGNSAWLKTEDAIKIVTKACNKLADHYDNSKRDLQNHIKKYAQYPDGPA